MGAFNFGLLVTMDALSLYTITCTTFRSSIVQFKVGIRVDKVSVGSSAGIVLHAGR